MYARPVRAHLETVVVDGIEVRDLVCSEDVVAVLGDLGLERRHGSEGLALEDPAEQLDLSGEDHRLVLEVLNVGALGEELWHIVDIVSSLPGKQLRRAGEDRSADEDGDGGKLCDELLHQGKVLGSVILLNDFVAYYSATAAMKSTTRQNDSKEREGILETTTNGSAGPQLLTQLYYHQGWQHSRDCVHTNSCRAAFRR